MADETKAAPTDGTEFRAEQAQGTPAPKPKADPIEEVKFIEETIVKPAPRLVPQPPAFAANVQPPIPPSTLAKPTPLPPQIPPPPPPAPPPIPPAPPPAILSALTTQPTGGGEKPMSDLLKGIKLPERRDAGDAKAAKPHVFDTLLGNTP